MNQLSTNDDQFNASDFERAVQRACDLQQAFDDGKHVFYVHTGVEEYPKQNEPDRVLLMNRIGSVLSIRTENGRFSVVQASDVHTNVSVDKTEEIEGCYFKDRPLNLQLISGLPLPKDADGVVRNKHFIDCTFHPNCQDVKFENCLFTRCDR